MVLFGVRNSFGVFFKPLVEEFRWSRAATSAGFTLSFFAIGAMSVLMGNLADRFGPRLTAVLGGIALGAGFLLMSVIKTVWQFYLVYGLVIAGGISSAIPLMATPARWFQKGRGLMTGLAQSGVGIGNIIIPVVANWLIASYNWRVSYTVLGIASLAVILPAAQFLKRDPAEMGLLPFGAEGSQTQSKSESGASLTVNGALGTRVFWTISLAWFCFNFCLQTVIVHVALYATGLGVSTAEAAGIIAVIGGASIPGRLAMGAAMDRLGSKLAVSICFALLVASLIFLLFTRSALAFYLFAGVFGFAYGGQAALQSPVIAEYFGLASLSAIYGAFSFVFYSGGIGPVIAGRIFDVTGSYYYAFLTCIALAGVGLILILLLRPSGLKES